MKNDRYQNLTFDEDFWEMNRLKAEFPTSRTFSLLQSEKLWICKWDFFSKSLMLEIELGIHLGEPDSKESI